MACKVSKVSVCVAVRKLKPDEEAELRAVFDKMDIDGRLRQPPASVACVRAQESPKP
jgi:hypothetical protein